MTEETPGPGHNKPPADPLKIRTDDLVAKANAWAKTEIGDQENADRLSAFIDQINTATKEIEATRKKEKQPHLDAGAAVDEKYNPLKSLLETAKKLVNPKLTAWLQKLEDEKKERERKAEEEADRLAEEARKAAELAAAEAAKGGDVVQATVLAEAAAETAQQAQKQAIKVAAAPVNFKSSLGARTKSLRTYWHARVTSHLAALNHFRNDPEIIETVARLAERAAGENAPPIPGVEFYSESKAA